LTTVARKSRQTLRDWDLGLQALSTDAVIDIMTSVLLAKVSAYLDPISFQKPSIPPMRSLFFPGTLQLEMVVGRTLYPLALLDTTAMTLLYPRQTGLRSRHLRCLSLGFVQDGRCGLCLCLLNRQAVEMIVVVERQT
jgi:hypothetical protein